MKTNIIMTKVWEDDFSAEFNIKFETEVNYEPFVVSGNFYLSKTDFVELETAIGGNSGSVKFGVEDNFCELKITTSSRGLKNINYHLNTTNNENDVENKVNVSINTGFIIEAATIDRILPKIKNFFNQPITSQVSLVYDEE